MLALSWAQTCYKVKCVFTWAHKCCKLQQGEIVRTSKADSNKTMTAKARKSTNHTGQGWGSNLRFVALARPRLEDTETVPHLTLGGVQRQMNPVLYNCETGFLWQLISKSGGGSRWVGSPKLRPPNIQLRTCTFRVDPPKIQGAHRYLLQLKLNNYAELWQCIYLKLILQL